MINKYLAVLIILCACGTASFAGTEQLKICGSTTTYAILFPRLKEVEKLSGLSVTMLQNSTGAGVADLVQKRCQLAMTSEPLDIAIQAAKLTGATVDSSKLKIYVVTTQEVAFVVNRANPVSKLTWDQMRDIQTGVIRTWDMVGGSKAIINVYAGKSGRGTRALVKSKIMHDLEFMKATIEEETIERAAELVSNDPAGFAAVGIQFAKKFPLKTIESEKLRRPIGFIADHELSENEKKLVKAYDSLFHATP